MLILSGSNALSTFRTSGLLSRLQAVDANIVGVTARYVHFVDVQTALNDDDMNRLKACWCTVMLIQVAKRVIVLS